jgi:hypothetical protein
MKMQGSFFAEFLGKDGRQDHRYGRNGCQHPGRQDMKSTIGAIILIVLGTVFLLNNLGIARLSIHEIIAKWWPAILIIVGISLLTRRMKK